MADGPERERYYPTEGRELGDAVLEAIERYQGTELTRSDFVLYDSIDPEALGNLFRAKSDSNVEVRFDVRDVTVEVSENDGVEILVF